MKKNLISPLLAVANQKALVLPRDGRAKLEIANHVNFMDMFVISTLLNMDVRRLNLENFDR